MSDRIVATRKLARDEARAPSRRRDRAWYWALAGAYLLAGALAFVPGLWAGFVSDTFVFLEIVRAPSAEMVAKWFVPEGDRFYRPLYLAILWGSRRMFGTDPLGYHVIAWLAHVLSALLVSAIGLSIARDRTAAAVAGFAFLLSIHAHEVVYDVATLHHALGGLMLLAAVLAWIRGRAALALAFTAAGMLVNELALLVVPILATYELCSPSPESAVARALAALRRLAPALALLVGYFVFRLGIAGAELPSEGATCLRPRCLAVAAAEYTNRLLLRPDAVLAHAWTARPPLALTATAMACMVACLLRPWSWARWSPAVFAMGWTLIAVAYVVVGLWPYVSDRMLYVPDMGLALLLGCLAGEGVRLTRGASGAARVMAGLGLAVIAAWIVLGVPMLRARGVLWSAAGREAERILADVRAAALSLPPHASLCVRGVPDSYRIVVPPGNTGPYVFRNGLSAGLRSSSERSDVRLVRDCAGASATLSLREAPARLGQP